MNIKVIISFLVCILLVFNCSLAQQKGVKANSKSMLSASSSSSSGSEVSSSTGLRLSETTLEGEAGNLYVGEAWPEGLLVLKDGNTIKNYRYRYDVYADQMQFIADNDTLAFAAPSEMKSVTFDGMTFIYSSFECTSMLMKGYFELLVPGKKQLLLKRMVTYHLTDEIAGVEEKKDTYLINETFFLKEGNQPAIKLACNRKAALDAMNDRRKEMEAYLKTSGNKVRSKDEMKLMVAYYNSLK
jgi:hypothetical protein